MLFSNVCFVRGFPATFSVEWLATLKVSVENRRQPNSITVHTPMSLNVAKFAVHSCWKRYYDQNVEIQNVEIQNVKIQNVEIQNVKIQNVEIQNVNI
jgi:hypothetical protein